MDADTTGSRVRCSYGIRIVASAGGVSVAKFTICLDPGHGGQDPGAQRDNLKEADIVLDVGLRARDLLVPKYRVVLTRDSDKTVALSTRVAIADSAKADLFVSIHANASVNPQAQGYEVFVRNNPSADSLALASSILTQFAKRWPQRHSLGIGHADFLVVKQRRPACLVEGFFLSNPIERAMLALPAVRAQLAEAIAWGCGNFIATSLAPNV